MPLQAAATGSVSFDNSSSTALTANSIFTGAAEEVIGNANLSVFVFTDAPSATDGLQVQWSSDSINWDDFDKYTIPANTGKVFTFGIQARYARVVYTNGPYDQVNFRLQTIYHDIAPKPSSHRIADTFTDQNDAELGLVVVASKNTDGKYGPTDSVALESGGNIESIARATNVLSMILEELQEIRLLMEIN